MGGSPILAPIQKDIDYDQTFFWVIELYFFTLNILKSGWDILSVGIKSLKLIASLGIKLVVELAT